MAKKHMKRCSSLIIREMNTKTTVGYHFTSIRMAIIKNSTNNKCWRGCEGKGSVGENVTGTATMENSMKVHLKTKNTTTIWSSNPTPAHISGERCSLKHHSQQRRHRSNKTVYQ